MPYRYSPCNNPEERSSQYEVVLMLVLRNGKWSSALNSEGAWFESRLGHGLSWLGTFAYSLQANTGMLLKLCRSGFLLNRFKIYFIVSCDHATPSVLQAS